MTFVEIHWHSFWIHWHLLWLHWHSLVEAEKKMGFYLITFSNQDRQLKILLLFAHSITLLSIHRFIHYLFVYSSFTRLFIIHLSIHIHSLAHLSFIHSSFILSFTQIRCLLHDCWMKIDFVESCSKCCFLWIISFHIIDFLKQIYISRLKCSNEVDWNLICFIIIHLFHHYSLVLSSFICVIHLCHLFVSFICFIHLFYLFVSAKFIKSALFKNDKNENEWFIVEKLINMSIIFLLLTNHNTKRNFNLFSLFMLFNIVNEFCWDR